MIPLLVISIVLMQGAQVVGTYSLTWWQRGCVEDLTRAVRIYLDMLIPFFFFFFFLCSTFNLRDGQYVS
jgi:hypothetical protein